MSSSPPQFDPAVAWQPVGEGDWDLRWCAHLYRRAAFGAPALREGGPRTSWEAFRDAVRRGREACIDELLAGLPGQEDFQELIEAIGERISRAGAVAFSDRLPIEKLQGWWLYAMLHSRCPLRERMTLFWHDHFATSIAKVRNLSLMFQQNKRLRTHALGKFPDLLREISRDPAMLVWLDSNSNVRGGPNENFARELLELFTLGVGNYSEQDVREAARAFTGWGNDGGEFVFRPAQHDEGPKTILGQTGHWDGDDVLRIVLQQPAAARLLARKLFRVFVSEEPLPPGGPDGGAYENTLLAPLAEKLRETGYDITAALSMILRSRVFFSEAAWRARIKSPVEHVTGLVRIFDAKPPMENLAAAMDGLGQSLFEPPSVKGWDGGTEWLNSATLLARHNLAADLLSGSNEPLGQGLQPESLVREHAGDEPERQVDFLLELLLQHEIRATDRARLVGFARAHQDVNGRIRSLAHQIVMMPEYQLA
jgi:Protein of unknown function (DUF1800)